MAAAALPQRTEEQAAPAMSQQQQGVSFKDGKLMLNGKPLEQVMSAQQQGGQYEDDLPFWFIHFTKDSRKDGGGRYTPANGATGK